MKMDLKRMLEDVLVGLRNGLLYDEQKSDLKGRLLNAYDALTSILDAKDESKVQSGPPTWGRDESKVQWGRFAVTLPPYQVWVSGAEGNNGHYVTAPARTVFYINGYVTESKILAIKEVRTLDNCGLKEAKDYCDKLQDNAITQTKG